MKIVLIELLSLTNLLKPKILGIYKLKRIIIVNKNKNLIFTAFQVIASSFKGFNNSQKFFIIGFVAYLSQN